MPLSVFNPFLCLFHHFIYLVFMSQFQGHEACQNFTLTCPQSLVAHNFTGVGLHPSVRGAVKKSEVKCMLLQLLRSFAGSPDKTFS